MRNTEAQEFKCANCKFRKNADENPFSWKAKLWQWHTGWCPGWKAYQKHLQKTK